MKTKDLIAELQKADPSGENECCIGNADIHCVYAEPAYWDGCLQVLLRDKSNPYYNIIGAKYVGTGTKVVISPLSISDAIFEDENLPVTYEGISDFKIKSYEEKIQKARKETNEINNSCEKGFFVKYIVKKYSNLVSENELTRIAEKYYEDNLDYQDGMPKDILTLKRKEKINDVEYEVIPSWLERREMQWDREITIDFDNGIPFLKIPGQKIFIEN